MTEIEELKHFLDIARRGLPQDLQVSEDVWAERIAIGLHEAGYRRQGVLIAAEDVQ